MIGSLTQPLQNFFIPIPVFGCTGGLLFPYYIGIIIALRDELKVLREFTPVAGASAGSLIAATCKSGISEVDLIQASWI